MSDHGYGHYNHIMGTRDFGGIAEFARLWMTASSHPSFVYTETRPLTVDRGQLAIHHEGDKNAGRTPRTWKTALLLGASLDSWLYTTNGEPHRLSLVVESRQDMYEAQVLPRSTLLPVVQVEAGGRQGEYVALYSRIGRRNFNGTLAAISENGQIRLLPDVELLGAMAIADIPTNQSDIPLI